MENWKILVATFIGSYTGTLVFFFCLVKWVGTRLDVNDRINGRN